MDKDTARKNTADKQTAWTMIQREKVQQTNSMDSEKEYK